MTLITPADYLPHARQHEGAISWMYKDSVGVVTIGIGHALETAAEARHIFLINQDEAEADWTTIKSMLAGRVAAYYAAYTKLRITERAIDALFERDCAEEIADLARVIPGFADFPKAAQIALIDLDFNLGTDGLKKKFPKLMAAVRARNWAVCAIESNRPQLSQARNDWTRQQFMAAERESLRPSLTKAEMDAGYAIVRKRFEPHDPHYAPIDKYKMTPLSEEKIRLDSERLYGPRTQPASQTHPAPATVESSVPPEPPGLRAPAADAMPPSPADGGLNPEPRAPESPKPLSHSRTIGGATIAATATGVQIVADQGYGWLNTLQDWTGSLRELSDPLNDLAPFIDSLKIVVPLIALAGVALAIYARWDDRRKLGR